MAQITLKGSKVETVGELPASGSKAPEFLLTREDLSDVHLENYLGNKVRLSIFPSIDDPVCQAAARSFNEKIAAVPGVKLLCISADLPFALKRFCAAEGLDAVENLSEFRTHTFGDDYGVRIKTGPLAGLLSRAVLVLDENGVVIHRQQVGEIAEEPDYDAVFQAVA